MPDHGRADRYSNRCRRGNNAWLALCYRQGAAAKATSVRLPRVGEFQFFAAFESALFEEAAADQFDQFNRIRIAARDRKIAKIAAICEESEP